MSLGRRLISTASPEISLFKVVLYTGNGGTKSVTGVGFQPDFVWIKPRSIADNHNIFDSIRGVTKQLLPNGTSAESTQPNTLTSFDSDGFTTSSDNNTNTNEATYVAWNFKAGGSVSAGNNTVGDITSTVSANQDGGFSIVRYTGTSSYTDTVGHGLTSAPEIIIQKNLNQPGGAVDWYVHTDLIDGSNDYLVLNSTAQKADNGQNFAFNTTTFTNWGWDGYDMINYCFHSVSGVSKMETYTGTSSTLRIYTTDDNTSSGSNPFEPSFLIIKRTDSADAWQMYDNQRGVTKQLMAQSADEEYTQDGTSLISFNSDGFTLGVDNSERVNKASAKYLFMAFK